MQEPKKAKDFQPPFQDVQEGLSTEQLEGDRQGWQKEDIENITDEVSNRDPDGVLRQTLGDDETKGDGDEPDVAGGSKYTKTPHGQEENKKDHKRTANSNG